MGREIARRDDLDIPEDFALCRVAEDAFDEDRTDQRLAVVAIRQRTIYSRGAGEPHRKQFHYLCVYLITAVLEIAKDAAQAIRVGPKPFQPETVNTGFLGGPLADRRVDDMPEGECLHDGTATIVYADMPPTMMGQDGVELSLIEYDGMGRRYAGGTKSLLPHEWSRKENVAGGSILQVV